MDQRPQGKRSSQIERLALNSVNEETVLYEQFWRHIEDFPLDDSIDIDSETGALQKTLAIRRAGKGNQFVMVSY